jgi:hypothetical protein
MRSLVGAVIGAALLLTGLGAGTASAQTAWPASVARAAVTSCAGDLSVRVCVCMMPTIEALWTPRQFVAAFGSGAAAIPAADLLVFTDIMQDCIDS